MLAWLAVHLYAKKHFDAALSPVVGNFCPPQYLFRDSFFVVVENHLNINNARIFWRQFLFKSAVMSKFTVLIVSDFISQDSVGMGSCEIRR